LQGLDSQGSDGEQEPESPTIAVNRASSAAAASKLSLLSPAAAALRAALTAAVVPDHADGIQALRYADDGLPPIRGSDRARLFFVAENVCREGGAYGGDGWLMDGHKFAIELGLAAPESAPPGILDGGVSGALSQFQTKSDGRRIRQQWPLFRRWNFSPRLMLRPKSVPFVGLKNQSCTCYMNSLLQLLFLIPRFRQAVLHAWPGGRNPEGPSQMPAQAIVSNESKNVGVLRSLRMLFGHLAESPRRWVDTIDFCRVFPGDDGAPLNVREQKDAQEFAQKLFELLEDADGSAREALGRSDAEPRRNPRCTGWLRRKMHRAIGGSVVNQVISRGEKPYISERVEKFNILTVELTEKETLEDSLRQHIQPELLTGENQYRLPDGTKTDATRRVLIRQLPPHLILHLNRLKFDLRSMRKVKDNGRLAFPDVVDMRQYCEVGPGGDEGREAKVAMERQADE